MFYLIINYCVAWLLLSRLRPINYISTPMGVAEERATWHITNTPINYICIK